MPYVIEVLLFILPFALYALWRKLNPDAAPNQRLLLMALIGIAFAMGGAVYYGLSRRMQGDVVYVPPRWDGGRVEPGHAEPRPEDAPRAQTPPPSPPP